MVEIEKKKNIAVLGGTFDPPTISHLQIVCEVYNTFNDIDEVWFVPCGDERQDKTPEASSFHRLNMIEKLKQDLITESIPIKIIDIEINSKFLPTYKLLQLLQQKYPNYTFELIVGSEIIDDYITWENFNELKEECKFIILERKDKRYNEANLPKHKRNLDITIDLGDQNIKDRIKQKTNKKNNFGISGLTSKSVIKYIKDNNLYQS